MTETPFDPAALANKLSAEAQAGAGYGMAMTMATEAAKNVGVSSAEARKAKLAEKVANAKREQLKGNEKVNNLAATCLEGIAAAKNGWAKSLEGRAEGRLKSAKAREASLAKLDAARTNRGILETSHQAQKAVGKEQPSDKSVRKDRAWWPVRLYEWARNGIDNVAEWAHATRVVANEAVATKYSRKAGEWHEAAARNLARAAERRSGTLIAPDKLKAMQQEISAKAPSAEDLVTTAERAKQAQKALENIKKEQYFAPEATELHDQIVSTGGANASEQIAKAAQEWAGKAAGANATS